MRDPTDRDVGALLDLARYPLHRPDTAAGRIVIGDARAQMLARGICALPGFVVAEAADRMATSLLRRFDRMCTSAVSHNIYQEPDADPAFDAEHPRNRQLRSECRCLPDDEIPADAPLRVVYRWEPLARFVSAVVHGPAAPPLYRFADPLGALTVNVVLDGQQIAWHFDQAPFVVVLLLRNAQRGGAYEVAPESRLLADGSPDYALHRRVLDEREPSVLSRRFAPGTLVVHRGTQSLHRVAPVHGPVARVSALLSYADRPDAMLTAEVRRAYYGRTQPR
jgi:hypothetical protein